MSTPILRVARPTNHLQAIGKMYREGLGFQVIGSFDDHDGFDGIMLGYPQAPYHLEFTSKRGHQAPGSPSEDNLLVFYVADTGAWLRRSELMLTAGFKRVVAFNPYWDRSGHTYEDLDGYRVVIQNTA